MNPPDRPILPFPVPPPRTATTGLPQGFDAPAYFETVVSGGRRDETVASGFPSLDALLGGGLRRGDLVVVGGDVGMGKSAFALAIALRAAGAGRAVAFLSAEMTAERLIERALAVEGRVTVDALRGGALDDAAHAAVAAAALRLRERSPVWLPLNDAGASAVGDATVEYLGLELVIVDSLQSLASGAAAMEDELAHAVRKMKELAVRRGCAVVLVSHLTTTPGARTDPRPRLEDFGALGAVRQHADVVLGVFREEVYSASRDVEGATELHVLKNRNGALGYIDLFFYKQWLRFEDMVEPDR